VDVAEEVMGNPGLITAIREALPEEAASLSSLAQESKAHWGYPAEVLAGWRQELTVTPLDLARHAAGVAEAGTDIAGFYMLCHQDTVCMLEHLWVRPRWMHQGVGAMLLSHALLLAHTRHCSPVQVVSDPHAAGFYARLGGIPTGHIPAPLPGAPDRMLPVYEFALADNGRSHRYGGP